MAPASTEIGPFFATSYHAPIELPEHVLTMIVLLLRDSTSAAADAEARSLYSGLIGGIGSVCHADAEARSLYSGLIGGIGSVCRSWRRAS